jgi:predicted regulator of Ras-like GTPase activity (Roadblock/LC7/MglB family)
MLAAIAGKDAKLGAIFLQMGHTAESVKETVGS